MISHFNKVHPNGPVERDDFFVSIGLFFRFRVVFRRRLLQCRKSTASTRATDLLAPFHAEHCAGAKKELIGEVALGKPCLIVAIPTWPRKLPPSGTPSSRSLKKSGAVDQHLGRPGWRQAQARPQAVGRRRPRPLLPGSVRRTPDALHPGRGALPVAGLSNISKEQTEILAALAIKKPTLKTQLTLL